MSKSPQAPHEAAADSSPSQNMADLNRPTSQPVTVWTLWTPPTKPRGEKPAKPGYWEFNHLEDGHSEALTPADAFGRGWERATWRRAHGVLATGHPTSRWGSPALVCDFRHDTE